MEFGSPEAASRSLLILDFDGVVADSEVIANQALADYLTSIGHPTSLDEAIAMFMGRRHADTLAAIVNYIGRPLPPTFETEHRTRVRAVMRGTVMPVAGVDGFLSRTTGFKKCVASSSSREWLDHCVDRFGFRQSLGDNLFSATLVANGKPAPDIFLHAARAMGGMPEATVVIEDSVAGVKGARAAGMTVIGFLGGSHIRPGHADHLREAGAHALAEDFSEAESHLRAHEQRLRG